jgi:hypothetical protein
VLDFADMHDRPAHPFLVSPSRRALRLPLLLRR